MDLPEVAGCLFNRSGVQFTRIFGFSGYLYMGGKIKAGKKFIEPSFQPNLSGIYA